MIEVPITTNDQIENSTSALLKNKRLMASLIIHADVARSKRVSKSAERFYTLPCPQLCSGSGGVSEIRMAKKVISAAAKSSAECAASAKIPSELVSTPTMILNEVKPIAAMTELRAADRFSS